MSIATAPKPIVPSATLRALARSESRGSGSGSGLDDDDVGINERDATLDSGRLRRSRAPRNADDNDGGPPSSCNYANGSHDSQAKPNHTTPHHTTSHPSIMRRRALDVRTLTRRPDDDDDKTYPIGAVLAPPIVQSIQRQRRALVARTITPGVRFVEYSSSSSKIENQTRTMITPRRGLFHHRSSGSMGYELAMQWTELMD